MSDRGIISGALAVAAMGYGVNRYMDHKLKTEGKGYLESDDQRAKMLGGLVGILGLATAAGIKLTEGRPKARKIMYGTIAAGTVGYFLLIVAAMKKMT